MKSAGRATQPLPGASVSFAPLPKGALLGQGRYVVVALRSSDEHQNVYLVDDTTPIRRCPECRTDLTNLAERFCPTCGSDVTGVMPFYLRYAVRESADPQAFAAEERLLQLGLDHPALLLPYAFFVEAPYGPPRRYLVEAEFIPPSAATLSGGQGLHGVLEWGIALAQGLEALHRHGVVLGETGPESIVVEGRTARWARFAAATLLPVAGRTAADPRFAGDVRGLVRTLLYLLTGQWHGVTGLPAPVAAFFSDTLSPQSTLTAEALAGALKTMLEEQRRPSGVTFVVGRRSDVGQTRALNEDCLLSLEMTTVFGSVSMPVGLFVVADGMGGHESGDVASQIAVRTIAEQAALDLLSAAAAGRPLPPAGEWLTAAVQAANGEVHQRRQAAGNDMGCTLVAALLVGDTATIANVGDSRAYRLGPDGIVQITTDHSLVERMVATGQITREEAATHPQRHVIYRVIGDKPRVEVDLFERHLLPGEALLLCSDGLSGMLPDEQIWSIWRACAGPQQACERLVAAANRAGGKDNISVVIVQPLPFTAV